MLNIVNATKAKEITLLAITEFERGFLGFNEAIQAAAAKGIPHAIVKIDAAWGSKYDSRISAVLHALGYHDIRVYDNTVSLSWEDRLAYEDPDIRSAFVAMMGRTNPGAPIREVLRRLMEYSSTEVIDGEYSIIIEPPSEIWGLVDPGFLKEAIEAGGLFPVKTWEDNRIVAVWKL